MTWLAGVLTQYSEPAEADLHREYGIELADFYRGKITARALSVRLRFLPRGALLWQVMHNDKAWSQESYLLAHTVDALRGANWQRSGGEKPKPIERPADKRVARVVDLKNQARAARWLAKQTTPQGGEG